MAVDPLRWIFVTGLVWFSLVALVVSAVATWLWRRTKRENPGHLVMWTALAFAGFYLLQLLDWGFWLRNLDGVEFPWSRGASQIIGYFFFSWMVATSLWVDWDDAFMVVGAHTVVGALLFAGDFTGGRVGWYWWSSAVAVLAGAQLFLLRRARQSSGKSWLIWLGWLVYALGVPIGQAFGWTLGKVLERPPERKNTEIYYLVIYAVGLSLYGGVMVWAYSKRPARTQPSTRETPVLFPSGPPGRAVPPTHGVALSSTMSLRTPYPAST
jgi:hypothetical protein